MGAGVFIAKKKNYCGLALDKSLKDIFLVIKSSFAKKCYF